jgi:hypothetical protein
MQWPTLFVLGALTSLSSALLRFQCSQLVVQRLDPLVAPGQIPSTHLYQIVGGVRIKNCVFYLILTDDNRTPLMLRWILRLWTSRLHQPAQLAPSAKTSRITGLLFSSSKRGTGHTSAFLRYPRSRVPLLGLQFITCKMLFTTPSNSQRSRHSSL